MGPLYPDVPITAGVPPVLRLPGFQDDPVTPLSRDSREIDDIAAKTWGIFNMDGTPIVKPDNVAAIEDGVEYRISDYPLEKGAFESYNKVATPREIRVAMSKGGSLGERQQFLETLKSLEAKLDLYSVVTPEEMFINMNIESVRKARNQTNGATMLTVEVMLKEIRISATGTLSNSKEPSGADMVNDGAVQTKAGIGDPLEYT